MFYHILEPKMFSSKSSWVENVSKVHKLYNYVIINDTTHAKYRRCEGFQLQISVIWEEI